MNSIQLAGCVIYNENNKILLIHRNSPKRTQWELPGGKIDQGENPEETAKRELFEELGVEVSIMKKLGNESFPEDGHMLDYIWFLAEIRKGKPVLKEKKFDGLYYFGWEELRDSGLSLSANTKNLVKAYFNKTLSN